MKLALVIDTDSKEVKQKRRPVLVYAWSIIKGVRKTYGTREQHERDYDLLTVPGIEVAS
jgi:hypothetical protein